MTSLQCVKAFSPTAVCFEGEQNREGYEALKRTIFTQVGWGHYNDAKERTRQTKKNQKGNKKNQGQTTS